MTDTENSGHSSNNQPNSFAAADTIESNQLMFTALTEALQKALISMGNQLHEHSKTNK